MDKKLTPKKFLPITFDRYTNKIKCTFRQNDLALNEFTTSASGDHTYTNSYEENGCKVSYSIRVSSKYPNRMFNANYPSEISVHGNPDLMGVRIAAIMPLKTLKLDDVSGIRTEEVRYSDKDVSISATFEISNELIIKASRQKLKKR